MSLAPGSMIGKCRITREIGRGGMGAVFLARHATLGIDVAIKVLPQDIALKSPDYAQRFLREARVAAALRHPNVVAIMDADRDEATGLYYIVEEFVDGGSLSQRLKEKGAFSERAALAATAGILKALQVAMKQGIVHRDIKPDNILVTKDGRVKLGDLGLAKRTGNISSAPAITQTSATMGTPHYMSPEQIENTAGVDVRGDIYSLGATLYHLLALKPPYPGHEIYAVLHQVMTAPIPDIRAVRPDVSEGTARILMKMLAKKAEDRYQTPNDVLADLAKGAPALELAEAPRPAGAGAVLPSFVAAPPPVPATPGAPSLHVPSTGPVDLTASKTGRFAATPAQKGIWIIAGCCVLLLLFAMRMMLKSHDEPQEAPKKVADAEPGKGETPAPNPKPTPPNPQPTPLNPQPTPPDPLQPQPTPPAKDFTLHKGCIFGLNFEPDAEAEQDGRRLFLDATGASQNAAIAVRVPSAEGRVGHGGSFSGEGSYLSLAPLKTERTVALWVKPSAARPMVLYDGGTDDQRLKGFLLGLASIAGADGVFHSFTGIFGMAPEPKVFEGWHHVAISWDGNKSLRIAIDGDLPKAAALNFDPGESAGPRPGPRPEFAAQPLTLAEKPLPAADSTVIGRCKITGHPIFKPFAGLIDELAVWDRALTEEELKSLPAFAADGKSYVDAIRDANGSK